MGLLSFLFRRAPRVETPPPEITIRGAPFVASPISVIIHSDREDSPAPAVRSQPDRDPWNLGDIFCVIEYRDAANVVTRRRVTMRSIEEGPNAPLIHAVCHERQAVRTFRTDRIQCVITGDGEIIETRAFFKDVVGIDLGTAIATRKMTPAVDHTETLVSALAVLVCAAHADNSFHILELDAIQLYAERELIAQHKEGLIAQHPTIEAINQLCALIPNMRPQRDSLAGHILNITRMPRPHFERFRVALARVIRADGEIASGEVSFLKELDQLAGKRLQVRQEIIDQADKESRRNPH